MDDFIDLVSPSKYLHMKLTSHPPNISVYTNMDTLNLLLSIQKGRRERVVFWAWYPQDSLLLRATQLRKPNQVTLILFFGRAWIWNVTLFWTKMEAPRVLVFLREGSWPWWTPKKILNTKLFQNVNYGNHHYGYQKNHSIQVQRSTDQLSQMEIESSPLTFSTSPCKATKIMMLSLALIQSGKTLISAQCPGNSHHACSWSWGRHELPAAEEWGSGFSFGKRNGGPCSHHSLWHSHRPRHWATFGQEPHSAWSLTPGWVKSLSSGRSPPCITYFVVILHSFLWLFH